MGGFAKTMCRKVLLVLADRCVEGYRGTGVSNCLTPIGIDSDVGEEVQFKSLSRFVSLLQMLTECGNHLLSNPA